MYDKRPEQAGTSSSPKLGFLRLLPVFFDNSIPNESSNGR
jgi:hypothetical protein